MKRTMLLLLALASVATAQDTLTIATWNIENLGGSNRGFAGGYGSGNLPQRSDSDLQEIADFIKNEIKVDVIASEKNAITHFDGNILTGHGNIFCSFIYVSSKVRLVKTIEMDLPNLYIGGKRAFDRRPLLGYFEVREGSGTTNDFLLVNVHLTSGQNNDENHLAAMVIIQQNLYHLLNRNQVVESDKIVLGDFNDNPYAKRDDGKPRYMSFLYQYMAFKKYRNLVTETSEATRMNIGLTSVIDHVLINNSADKHIPTTQATVFRPSDSTPQGLATWRRTFSDHFPVLFELKIENDDDDVD